LTVGNATKKKVVPPAKECGSAREGDRNKKKQKTERKRARRPSFGSPQEKKGAVFTGGGGGGGGSRQCQTCSCEKKKAGGRKAIDRVGKRGKKKGKNFPGRQHKRGYTVAKGLQLKKRQRLDF